MLYYTVQVYSVPTDTDNQVPKTEDCTENQQSQCWMFQDSYKVQGWWRGWLKRLQAETGPMKFDGTAYSPGVFQGERPVWKSTEVYLRRISYDRPSLYELRYLPSRRRVLFIGRRRSKQCAWPGSSIPSPTESRLANQGLSATWKTGLAIPMQTEQTPFVSFLVSASNNCRPLLFKLCLTHLNVHYSDYTEEDRQSGTDYCE